MLALGGAALALNLGSSPLTAPHALTMSSVCQHRRAAVFLSETESKAPALEDGTETIKGVVVPTKQSPMNDPIALGMRRIFPAGSGKKIWFGVFKQDVVDSEVPTDAERAALRAKAAEQLTNIDAAERERRKLAGTALGAATGLLAVGLLVAEAPTLTRFAIAPPLFLSYGFLASAEEGL